jgi:uncharacterized repeat protein (TIGR01451 family)
MAHSTPGRFLSHPAGCGNGKTGRATLHTAAAAGLSFLLFCLPASAVIVGASGFGRIEYYTGFLGGSPGGCRFPFETRWGTFAGDPCTSGLVPIPRGMELNFDFIPGYQNGTGGPGVSLGATAFTFGFSPAGYGIFIPRFTTLTQDDPFKNSLLPAVIRISFSVSFAVGGPKGGVGLPKHVDTYSYPIFGTVPPAGLANHFIGVAVGGQINYFINGKPAGSSIFGDGAGNPFIRTVPGPFLVVVKGQPVNVPDIFAGSVLTLAGSITFMAGGDDGTVMELDPQVNPGLMAPFQLTLPAAPQTSIAQEGFHFFLSGEPNRFYVTQSSSNLVDWIPLQTVQLASNVVEIVDTSATNGKVRFYRAQLLPGGPTGTNLVVSAIAGPHGTVSPTNVVCFSGTNVTFTAAADTNYVVAGWTVDGEAVTNSGNNLTLTNVQADARVGVTFQAASDLAVAIAAAPDPVVVSNQLTYLITVTNSGISTSHNVTVSNTLPAAVDFVSAVASQGTWSSGTGVVTSALGDLPAGAAATLTVVVSPKTAGILTDLVQVWADEFEPMTNNNFAGTTTVVLEVPTIIAEPQSQSVRTGTNVSFSVTATNAMPPIVSWTLEGIDLMPQTNSPGALSYQWLFNGTNLVAATNQVLTLLTITTNDAGPYAVVVSNAATNVISQTATLSVVP